MSSFCHPTAGWPYVLDDSPTSPNPHTPRERFEEMRAMVVMLNEATKLVFSTTLKEVTWKNSRLLPHSTRARSRP